MKDPMHPTSDPELENQADASASQASDLQNTGIPEQSAPVSSDASVQSEPVASAKPEEADKQDENAAFADLAARLGEEIDSDPEAVPAEGSAAEEAEPEDANAQVEQLKAQVAELEEQLARARAETYNLQQEYSGYVKRSKTEMSAHRTDGQKAVLQVLLSVLDDVQAAREAGELQGPFESIANKLENTLETNFGLTRYGNNGDEFDPNVHEAMMAQSGGAGEPSIAQVLQPGYKVGDQVLRATKVIVNNPD
ncbi:nucleotide exchange factor GrpE [Varibaculum prostatecancerukia]|uniref:nucleotide exchange factor GrpE n=1 Tax=Varibaculum prostatecancerukia TaxID=2811781 RepID=UPI003BAA950F